MLEQPPDDPRAVKSAFRALEVLQLLTQSARPLSFSDCQQALAYPKASLHGLLRTMVAARWITYDAPTRRYALGVRVWEAGIAYTKMSPLEALAKPIMERVRDATSETVQLAVLDDFQVLYVAKIDGGHMLRLESCVGLRMQPHATGGGKILLSGLADEVLQAWLEHHTLEKYTPQTITSPAQLLEELAHIRHVGYAIDREEILMGATCVAVGIRNHLGAIIASMSVAGATVRLNRQEQQLAIRHLQTAAAELSAALGCSAPRVLALE
jgi:DNA-binding IclR family transcriptional regulator